MPGVPGHYYLSNARPLELIVHQIPGVFPGGGCSRTELTRTSDSKSCGMGYFQLLAWLAKRWLLLPQRYTAWAFTQDEYMSIYIPLKLTCSQQLWLHSSVGRALHRYRRGHGFESRWSLNFFQASLSQLLKLRINREDLSWRHLLITAVQTQSL